MLKSLQCLLVCSLLICIGCGSDNADFTTESHLSSGLVIILPGIEGESEFNRNIRRGLVNAGVSHALPIYRWGRPIPGLGPLLNQVDVIGNRLAGVRIARMIEEYQDEHPGRPVYLVGHSGGGGVAVFAAEGLSKGRKIEGLILLSASIWAGYDLTKAASHCRCGIVNFYNKGDVGLLGVATTIMGNVDGMRGPSAGLSGFDKPTSGSSQAKKDAYSMVFQIAMSRGMTHGDDPHFAATRPGFVSAYVAPWVSSTSWPAGMAIPAAMAETESIQVAQTTEKQQ